MEITGWYKKLHMRWDFVIDRKIASIADRHGNFIMSGLGLSMEEIEYCAEMLSCHPGLKGLFLNNCNLGAEKVRHLFPIFSNSNLEKIGLINNGIDDDTVLALTEALLSVPDSKITHLYLNDNNAITQLGVSGLGVLKSAMPDLVIEGIEFPGEVTQEKSQDFIAPTGKKRLHYEMTIQDLYDMFKTKLKNMRQTNSQNPQV